MEDLLVQEQTAERHVHDLLKKPEEPIVNLLRAFDQYRAACEACLLGDFTNSERREERLWHAHTEGKRYFHRALSDLRKRAVQEDVRASLHSLIKLYLQFLKSSEKFYRQYILMLHTNFDGIPELQAVAHQVKSDVVSESSQQPVAPDVRAKILAKCHQALIYLGDLSRYRASEKLDKNPDFGRSLGYYGLACTLLPGSGMGHHQQAVVQLEQRNHLRAIYHLYRAMVVEDPHPNAERNLQLEFDKTNTAWDKGELIQKGAPNDPEESKRALVGWFVRLHSMCYKGEPFRGFEELEREVLSRLANVIKQRPLDGTLTCMIAINLAAQHEAGEKFQKLQTLGYQQAFLYSLRFNIRTFTTLLQAFYDELHAAGESETMPDDATLADELSPTARRLLPGLRLYSSWLLKTSHLVNGLLSDEFIGPAARDMWSTYCRATDLIAQAFPIWDLDELPPVTYLLEEDADTLGFKPLVGEETRKFLVDPISGNMKPRFCDLGIVQVSTDVEMVVRVRDFLSDALYFANDVESAPIRLRGPRIVNGHSDELFALPDRYKQPHFTARKAGAYPTEAQQFRQPLTYTVTAASGRAHVAEASMPNGESSASSRAHEKQLRRMVDELVDDDDGNNPVTPPQNHTITPTVVTNGENLYAGLTDAVQDFNVTSYQPKMPSSRPFGPSQQPAAPSGRTPRSTITGNSRERLQSVSSLWNDFQSSTTSPSFPPGLPTGTLSSPAQLSKQSHSRVNSASSIRSRTSQNIGDSWSSIESAPRVRSGPILGAPAVDNYTTLTDSSVVTPLLFGTGGIWSTGGQTTTYRNGSPPNGQGG